MSFWIEPMSHADIREVMDVERESFARPWDYDSYQAELKKTISHYFVLRCPAIPRTDTPDHTLSAPEMVPVERRGLPASLARLTHRLLGLDTLAAQTPPQITIAGHIGIWMVVDEAHITTIATRHMFRGRGLGELLLITAAELAMALGGRWLTLEVRVSNIPAQSLYRKYGFKASGVRPRYYNDNYEDALIMWTEELSSSAFQSLYHENRRALYARLLAAGDLAVTAIPDDLRDELLARQVVREI